MTLEEALRTFLLADSSISVLVGTRIGPWAAQGEVLPRITFAIISTQDEQSLTESTDEPVVRLQLDIWAATRDGARSLARLVKNSRGGASAPAKRLREYQGTMAGSLVVQSCFLENELDGEEIGDLGESSPSPCRIIQDWKFAIIEQ